MRIDGGCHCGAITYTAKVDPERISICHCTDCQTLSGSAYRVSILTAHDHVRVSGTPTIYLKTADSGEIRRQHFCADCGTPLFASGADLDSGEWSVRWGSIRQRDQLTPKRQIWCRSAVPWIGGVSVLPGREME